MKVDFDHKNVDPDISPFSEPTAEANDEVDMALPQHALPAEKEMPPVMEPLPQHQSAEKNALHTETPVFHSPSGFPLMPRVQEVSEDADTEKSDNSSDSSNDSEGEYKTYTQEEIDREKQGYLLELDKLSMQGVTLTKKYSMEDTLEAIQYEYERIKMNMDTMNAVNFMRDVLKLVLTGVELANSNLGPILHLDGWSNEVTTDMHRYDHCLERLYKKHWRKGSMSPESELVFLLVGSMVMFHFKSKFFGGTRASASASTSAPCPWREAEAALAPTKATAGPSCAAPRRAAAAAAAAAARADLGLAWERLEV